MSWKVVFTKKSTKQARELPGPVMENIRVLALEIQLYGPVRGNWKNYGKLGHDGRHHCHIKSGRPTYVACWQVKDTQVLMVEVYYVGTHEKAPY